jgi:acetyl esterase
MAAIFDACYIDPTQAKDPFVSPVYATQEELKGLPPALFILAGRDSLHDKGLRYCEMLETLKSSRNAMNIPMQCLASH